MSFNDLKVSELKKVADEFGVEYPNPVRKADLLLLLEEEGVTWQMYDKFVNAEKAEVEREPRKPDLSNFSTEQTVLVKMTRQNFSYQIGNITFTNEHPFVPLPASIAQEIFSTHEGFVPATPLEVQEFYDRR